MLSKIIEIINLKIIVKLQELLLKINFGNCSFQATKVTNFL